MTALACRSVTPAARSPLENAWKRAVSATAKMASATTISMSVKPRCRLRSHRRSLCDRESLIDLHAAADPIDDDVVLPCLRGEPDATSCRGSVGIEANATRAAIDELLHGRVEAYPN